MGWDGVIVVGAVVIVVVVVVEVEVLGDMYEEGG